jgi:mRNA interferase MazF
MVRRSGLPRRGDVWWLESPEMGRRPVLVVTRDSAIDVLTGIVVAPITRTVRNIDSEIPLDSDDGMPEPCSASFDNLRTVPISMMVTKLTRLSSERLPEICGAISFALECD